MQRNREGLVSIGEAFSGLDGPVEKALREASPQARHHFTCFDQVNQLVGASEADPDLGFMARMMALCSLPRTNPGNRKEYVRRNGPYTLVMSAGGLNKLPFGNMPRLLLAWVCTEVVRTQGRVLILGSSLSDFMRKLEIHPQSQSGGRNGVRTRLRNQMKRLFDCTVKLIYENERSKATVNSLIARRTEFWWNEHKPDQFSLWESKIELGEDLFYNEIIQPPRAARHEHPQGPHALRPGPRSVPLVGVPDVRPSYPATAHLAATLPAVRHGPGQGQRQANRQNLPSPSPPRVEEDQARLAWPELRDRTGCSDPFALDPRDPSGSRTSFTSLNSLSWPLSCPSAALPRPDGLVVYPRLPEWSESVKHLFPQVSVIHRSFPRLKLSPPHPDSSPKTVPPAARFVA